MFFQVADRYVPVEHRGFMTFVTEQDLDIPYVDPPLQQVRGVAVAQSGQSDRG